MAFMPNLRRALGGRGSEIKVVAPTSLSTYYSALASHYGGLTRDWPVERAVAEGYDRVIWVFKSVNTIGQDQSRLPFILREGPGDDAPIVEDHPLYRVLNTGKANPLETGKVLRKRLSAQILLSKRGAFVEVTKSNAGTVKRLDLLPPERVKIIPGTGADLISHFELTLRMGGVRNLDPDKVRWFRDPHPIDPYSGVTPLESMGMSVELDHFARLYNVTFMSNDGRPAGVLAVRDSKGGIAEVDEKIMNRIEDRFAKGPQEAGKLSVLAGELDYVDLATRPRDMQYENTAKNAKTEILSGFGVGESVLGDASGRTFDNADNELYVYWTRTMPGHMDIITTGFDEDSEDNLYGYLDTTKVEVLERAAQKARTEYREEVSAGLRSIWSYAQKAGMKEEIESTPHTRALYVPSGKTPLPSTAADAAALGLAQPVDEGAETPAPGGEEGGPGELPAGPAAPPALPPGRSAGPPTTEPGAAPEPTRGAPTPEARPGGAPSGAARAALDAVAGRAPQQKSRLGLRVIEGGRRRASGE